MLTEEQVQELRELVQELESGYRLDYSDGARQDPGEYIAGVEEGRRKAAERIREIIVK
jgi:exonuclease VII small subunit